MDAFNVSSAARVAGWIEAELILAARAADGSEVSLAIPAVDGPMIVAVIVYGPVAVEE